MLLRRPSVFGYPNQWMAPDKRVSATWAIMFIAMGAVLIAIDVYYGLRGGFMTAGIPLVVMAVAYAAFMWNRCNRYDSGYERYLRRRNAVRIEDYLPTKTTSA